MNKKVANHTSQENFKMYENTDVFSSELFFTKLVII